MNTSHVVNLPNMSITKEPRPTRCEVDARMFFFLPRDCELVDT